MGHFSLPTRWQCAVPPVRGPSRYALLVAKRMQRAERALTPRAEHNALRKPRARHNLRMMTSGFHGTHGPWKTEIAFAGRARVGLHNSKHTARPCMNIFRCLPGISKFSSSGLGNQHHFTV